MKKCAASCPGLRVPETLQHLFQHIDLNKDNYINDLEKAIAIKSVSTCPDDIKKMMMWISQKMQKLGAITQLRELGNQKLPNGEVILLPPLLIGEFPMEEKKNTVLIYGHLDVQDAHLKNGWSSDPFVLTQRDGKLFGRGVSDDKGPILCWIHAIEAYQAIGKKLPVNIKFIFESMEESGSIGLEDFLQSEKNKFLTGIDCICISDSSWLGTNKPCITYGLRGLSYFGLKIVCAGKDLHSGVNGGAVSEAMSDLIYLLDTLVDGDGNILIKNIYKDVAPVTLEEKELYNTIDFDVTAYRYRVGLNCLAHMGVKEDVLTHQWAYPSLSIHGIQGAFSEAGQKTVIPHSVIAKFSIRTVPNQVPGKIEQYVRDHLKLHWDLRESINQMELIVMQHGKPWIEDTSHPNYKAGIKATNLVYGVEPDLIRGGGSNSVALILQEVTGQNVMLLPLQAGDDGSHSQNENIDIRNYIEGTKLLGAYLYLVAGI